MIYKEILDSRIDNPREISAKTLNRYFQENRWMTSTWKEDIQHK